MDAQSSQTASAGDLRDSDVYPVHRLDAWKTNYVFVAWIMRFNDVLDVEKLYSSLSELLEQGDWRKLGGRLKTTANGGLELHVPRKFTADQPAVSFSKVDHSSMSIYEDELASQFPEPQERPYSKVIYDEADFRCFAAPKDFPSTIPELIARSLPQIALQTTSFNDATLVSLVWPHTLMDGMGQTALLRSWSLMLAGRRDEVPPVIGAKSDVLDQLGTMSVPPRPLEIESRYPGLLGLAAFALRFLWRRFFYPPRQTRIVFLPRRAVDELKQRANADGDGSFLSEGDILTAWIWKVVTSAEAGSLPLTIIYLMNARGRVHWLEDANGGVYLQNISTIGGTYLTAQQTEGSIGAVAREHRQQMAKQATDEQFTIFLQKAWKSIGENKSPQTAFVGETNTQVKLMNNLTKASYIQVTDFSPAVVSQGERGKAPRANPPGTMVNYMHLIMRGPVKAVDNFYIVGKDHGGNYWLMGTVSDQAWSNFDQELEALQ